MLFPVLMAMVVFTAPTVASAQRVFVDRPDDVTGYQIHVMYVIPSDGPDEALDLNGTIQASFEVAQAWLAGQTGGRRLRLDTYAGSPDITFFRLSRTDAEIRAYGGFTRDQIEGELLAAGFNHPQKLYAVYWGGSRDVSCGGGAWPPALPGSAVTVSLRGLSGACPQFPSFSPDSQPGYWEFVVVHEILHGLGFVATCAPNHTLSGHVSDDPSDLMYAGPLPWRPSVLDVGHDDYFEHGNPGCLDLAKSAFLEPAVAGVTPPPTWPLIRLTQQTCGLESAAESLESRSAVSIRFVNSTREVVDLFWLDFQGARHFYARLQPWDIRTQGTYLTHPWVMADMQGKCVALFTTGAEQEPGAGTILFAVPGAPPTVRITRSAVEVRPGQPLIVGVEARNPGDRPAAELYVGVLLPDGQTAAFFSASGAVAGIASLGTPDRFVLMQLVTPGGAVGLPTLLQVTIPSSGVTPGTYPFFGVLVRPSAFQGGVIDAGDILAVDVQPVTISP